MRRGSPANVVLVPIIQGFMGPTFCDYKFRCKFDGFTTDHYVSGFKSSMILVGGAGSETGASDLMTNSLIQGVLITIRSIPGIAVICACG